MQERAEKFAPAAALALYLVLLVQCADDRLGVIGHQHRAAAVLMAVDLERQRQARHNEHIRRALVDCNT